MIVAAGVVAVVVLNFIEWHWIFLFVTKLRPPPPFLLCHDHGRDRREDGDGSQSQISKLNPKNCAGSGAGMETGCIRDRGPSPIA